MRAVLGQRLGMGFLPDLEMMARGGTLALLALWSLILIRWHWRLPAARYAVLLCATVACHLIAIMPQPVPGSVALNWVVEVGSGITSGAFWLVARSWFNDEQRHRRWPILLVGALAVLPLLAMYLEVDGGGIPRRIVGTIWRLATFGFAGAGIYIAWRGRADDLVELRRRVRTGLIWSVGAYVALVNTVEIWIFQFGAPYELRSLLVVGIAALTFALCTAIFNLRDNGLFGPPLLEREDELRRDDPDADLLAGRLATLMATEKPWRDETLSVASLAARLGIPEYRLRRLVNGHLGHRNFAAYLNGFRLDEVRAALADPSQREVPIVTIALDAGFGSLAPFNRAFRDVEGLTPTEYRAKALGSA